ncbi:hypothetical protein PBY51_003225 [Eleginops maclovinus]|uniref:Uncharacterized protein n=1 Tax=Eleginops maclovinus TaxID=56733 RepID=A0AAN7XG90_ELEMC|nr:hypothetical protein PBY51_003225 [Eleginops maclovinus]
METENEVLTNKVKELQHAENVRTIRREALQRELVADEEKMELEKENKRLKEEIKLEQLSGQKRQQQKHNLERDAQELQHILEKVEEDIRRKDEEIKQKSMTLNERCRGNENSYKTMKEQQELKQQLSIEADKRTAQRTSTMLPLGPLTLAEEDEQFNDERPLNNENYLDKHKPKLLALENPGWQEAWCPPGSDIMILCDGSRSKPTFNFRIQQQRRLWIIHYSSFPRL